VKNPLTVSLLALALVGCGGAAGASVTTNSAEAPTCTPAALDTAASSAAGGINPHFSSAACSQGWALAISLDPGFGSGTAVGVFRATGATWAEVNLDDGSSLICEIGKFGMPRQTFFGLSSRIHLTTPLSCPFGATTGTTSQAQATTPPATTHVFDGLDSQICNAWAPQSKNAHGFIAANNLPGLTGILSGMYHLVETLNPSGNPQPTPSAYSDLDTIFKDSATLNNDVGHNLPLLQTPIGPDVSALDGWCAGGGVTG
jgi:hypothetical protein